nr:MAG TPA: hypothetical protein [Caudoviricetes sp.]
MVAYSSLLTSTRPCSGRSSRSTPAMPSTRS